MHRCFISNPMRYVWFQMVEEELMQEISEEEKTKVWDDAAETVKTYHDELVRRWQVAMDSLLVYVSSLSMLLVTKP